MTAHISNDIPSREESVAEHTQKTVRLCLERGNRCGLSQLMSLCGLFHDIGKNKQKFDDYIHAGESMRQKLRGSVSHASTGAKYIYGKYHDAPGNTKFMVEMITYAIAAHHGLFDCVDIGHADIFSRKLDQIEDYEEACRNATADYLNEYDIDKIFADASKEFYSVWNRIKTLFDKVKPILLSKGKPDAVEKLSGFRLFLFSCLQRLILSMLIDADWQATSDFMDQTSAPAVQSALSAKEIFEKALENFDAYMQKKLQTAPVSQFTPKEKTIFDARNYLQGKCRQFAKYPAGIYCLPIPTGGGKTLDSLAYALEYCRQYPNTERIIYVSPYISITEQNAQVFRDAIGNDSWILEHHCSVIRTNETTNEDYHTSHFSRYDVNWEEPFICTTFVQFMNTLFSDKSESIRRMHRLINSVVIIDEVQSMPLKCVHTFNYMINFLCEVCHTNIILCTATQPALAEAECPICYGSPKYIIENATSWFHKFERVKIFTPASGAKYTFESLCSEIAGQASLYRSILVVLNTKPAVRKLYDLLKAQNINAQYLTTNLCAAHRSDKIASVKKILAEKQKSIVVISTSLIEAGVDISFECVYRSMTGLDSLAQTAGRCNRNGEREWGILHLIRLEGENTGSRKELLQNVRITESLIHQYNNSPKADSLLMPEWMDAYFRDVYFHASDIMNFPVEKMDTNILKLLSEGFGPREKKNYLNQAYKTAGQEYRVIDDHTFGVIVPYKKGGEIIESLQTASYESSIKAYIKQAQRYTVNVNGSLLPKLEGLISPVSKNIPKLYMTACPGAYNSDYGITPELETLLF